MSFLKDYRTVIESKTGKTTFIPDYAENNYEMDGIDSKIEIGWIYKKQTYGLIGSVGLKVFLSDKISYSTSLRYEYDLTTADNMSFTSSTGDFTPKNSTHNLRLGLELGLQYHFSINDRFNKSPHKL